MKKAKKVTRIAYSDELNQAKYDALHEIAKLCGAIRTEVWRNYGAQSGLGAKFRSVRDGWIAVGHIKNLPQRIWRVTLSDSLDDIKANREAAKEKVVSRFQFFFEKLKPRKPYF
jgi:hypothetical protein